MFSSGRTRLLRLTASMVVFHREATRLQLQSGSFLIMISDGIADETCDEWLQNLLAGWSGEDPQALANLVLKESIRREGLQDDCGVQVLYLDPAGRAEKV